MKTRWPISTRKNLQSCARFQDTHPLRLGKMSPTKALNIIYTAGRHDTDVYLDGVGQWDSCAGEARYPLLPDLDLVLATPKERLRTDRGPSQRAKEKEDHRRNAGAHVGSRAARSDLNLPFPAVPSRAVREWAKTVCEPGQRPLESLPNGRTKGSQPRHASSALSTRPRHPTLPRGHRRAVEVAAH